MVVLCRDREQAPRSGLVNDRPVRYPSIRDASPSGAIVTYHHLEKALPPTSTIASDDRDHRRGAGGGRWRAVARQQRRRGNRRDRQPLPLPCAAFGLQMVSRQPRQRGSRPRRRHRAARRCCSRSVSRWGRRSQRCDVCFRCRRHSRRQPPPRHRHASSRRVNVAPAGPPGGDDLAHENALERRASTTPQPAAPRPVIITPIE